MDEGMTVTEAPPPSASPPAPPAAPGARGDDSVPDRKGCLIAVIAAIVAVILLVVGVYLLFGRSTKPQDLDVAPSEADFQSALDKAGLVWPEPPAEGDISDYERVYKGSKPLDATFTEEEISALMSFYHDPSYWPIKDMQVHLTGGNTAEASAIVTYAGRDWPVYISGTAGIAGNVLDVSLASVRVAGTEAPSEYLPLGEDFLEDVVNPRLARIPGFNIESLEVTDEGVHVVGTIWETAEYVPRQ